jgi:hypothetical protein
MTALTTTSRDRLLRCGFALEHHAGLERRRRDCAHCGRRRLTLRRTDGFGLDSLIEIGASTVVIWELSSTGKDRQRRALRLIGWSFTALALYLAAQSTVALAIGHHAERTTLGIAWTAVTAAVMFALTAGKARTGAALNNPVLRTEGRVTLIDGLLAVAVLVGLALNAAAGWWWADPIAGYVIVCYAATEAWQLLRVH